jgi:hypothetical protein
MKTTDTQICARQAEDDGSNFVCGATSIAMQGYTLVARVCRTPDVPSPQPAHYDADAPTHLDQDHDHAYSRKQLTDNQQQPPIAAYAAACGRMLRTPSSFCLSDQQLLSLTMP